MSAESAPQASRPRFVVPTGLVELIRLAWPVVLSRLGIMAMGLTDAIVVGRHSARQLGYHALGWAPTSIVLVTAVGLLLGVQVMTARHIGEGRREAVGGVLRRGIVYAFWIGVGSVAILTLAGPVFLHAIGLEASLADGASAAMRVFAWSLPSYLVATASIYFLEALSRPKPAMVAMWLANAVNLAANLWLVPGHSGFPVEGAVAAGWATLIARTFLVLWLLGFIARMPEAKALGVFGKPVDGRAAAFEQLRIGFGSGASMFAEVSAFAAMTLIAGQLGALQAAAWAAIFNVTAIVFMFPLGLSAATAVLVGRAYGAGDRHGVVRAGLLGFGVTATGSFLISVAAALGAGAIASAYTTDPGLAPLIAGGVGLTSLFFVTDGLQVVAAQALRARSDVWLPTAFHLTSYGLIMLPMGWIFAHPMGWGINGLVWAVIIASAISGGLLVGRFLLLGSRI